MDSVIDISAARALAADGTLWPRARDFLWDFASLVHPSRLENMRILALTPSVMRTPRMKRYILDFLGVEPVFHSFPKGDASRILLTGFATIDSAAKWIGALAAADVLRRVTARAEVGALKIALPGIYPEVFSFTAYFRKDDLPECAAATPEAVVAAGYGAVAAALSDLSPALLRRFALTMPEREAALAAAPARGLSPGAARKTIYKLFKLKFPEAFALCCS